MPYSLCEIAYQMGFENPKYWVDAFLESEDNCNVTHSETGVEIRDKTLIEEFVDYLNKYKLNEDLF